MDNFLKASKSSEKSYTHWSYGTFDDSSGNSSKKSSGKSLKVFRIAESVLLPWICSGSYFPVVWITGLINTLQYLIRLERY
jgi:hypothetical protein